MHEQRLHFDIDAEPVDLGAPSRVVRGRLPAIEAIQDRLSRQLRVDLFQYLRYGLQIKQPQTNFEPHDEVIHKLSQPVLIGIVSIAPLRGFSIIAIDGALVGAAVDRLCGALEPSPPEERDEFSVFEMHIAQRLLKVIQASVKYAWQGVAELQIELVRTEVNSAFIAIADAQEPLIAMRVTVEMATGGGEIVVAIPYPAIEPIRDKLTSPAVLTEVRDEDKQYWDRQMRQATGSVPTTIRAELAQKSISTTELEALRPGQVLPIKIPSFARVYCDEKPLFAAEFGAREEMIALRVHHFINESSETEYESEQCSGTQHSERVETEAGDPR
jgi:flagellar motor switch protein FliM